MSRSLFKIIQHREQLSDTLFASPLQAARVAILRQAGTDVPATRAASNLAKRRAKYAECYFRFITTPGMDPTNNIAEQAIRFVVIDRPITHGTRSDGGQRWCERIWTLLATCTQQGQAVWDSLQAVVEAYFSGATAPRLLPESSGE